MKAHHQFIELDTITGVHIQDITQTLRDIVEQSAIKNGQMVVTSMHTTLAITVNEAEERLLTDIDNYFLSLAPPENRYLHNDLHLRDVPPDEPENAHAHLIAMMLGNSESLAIVDGGLMLGTYQSVMSVELDGARKRKISVQVLGV